MSRVPLKSSSLGIVILAAILSCVVACLADDNLPKHDKEVGTVLSTISQRGHFYQVSTDSRIYLLLCEHTGTIHLGPPECKVGNKPIAVGDTLHFRLKGDWVYLPAGSAETEQELRILTTELKVSPPLPPAASAPAGPPANPKHPTTNESGVVIGTGLHIKNQGMGWSTTPASAMAAAPTAASAATPVMATAPVMATPVTGGAPVLVTPVGPTSGGVVTGTPVTGGAPVTAVPVAPVTGIPVGATPAAGAPRPGGGMVVGGSVPQWVHVLRIQTATRIYQLECSGKPCSVAGKEIALGDPVVFLVDKKWAYLTPQGSAANQSPDSIQDEDGKPKFKILSVTENASPADSKNASTADSKPQ